MAAITRLGLSGFGVRKYGTFVAAPAYVPALPLRDVSYIPGILPTALEDYPRYLEEELHKIAATLDLVIAGYVQERFVAPPKPRNGDLVLADGTNWDPGSGAGIYYYQNNTWNKL